ncbi:TPA: LysR family transcriptional regulator [Vibrio vulnificus]|nr:LysR family transcriptional regulator [Vibrio vulnificus]
MARDLFSKLDLNLLRTFLILNQERNMRKAAERLFISQPAVSKSLQRLRDSFGDELFVKTYHGLKATEFAEQLAESLAPVMNDLMHVVNYSGGFDPSQIDRPLRIVVSPFLLTGIAQRLFTLIRAEAPHAQIQFLNWGKSSVEDIVNDKVHLGLNYAIERLPKEVLHTTIAKDTFRAYVRDDHPYKQSSARVEDGHQFEFSTLIAADWNYTQSVAEKLLQIYGHQAKVGFRSELPSAVIEVTKNSDMLFLGSRYLNLDGQSGLRSIDISFGPTPLNTDINVYFHEKYKASPTILWLKRKLAEALQEQGSASTTQ